MPVIDTADGIAFYRLAALKGALDLQTKGLKLSRGRSATSIAKAQYGLTGTAAKMLPVIEREVEDILTIRAGMDTTVAETFDLLGERVSKNPAARFDGDKGILYAYSLELNGVMEDTALTARQVEVLNALIRVTLFERRCPPSTRVVFRA